MVAPMSHQCPLQWVDLMASPGGTQRLKLWPVSQPAEFPPISVVPPRLWADVGGMSGGMTVDPSPGGMVTWVPMSTAGSAAMACDRLTTCTVEGAESLDQTDGPAESFMCERCRTNEAWERHLWS